MCLNKYISQYFFNLLLQKGFTLYKVAPFCSILKLIKNIRKTVCIINIYLNYENDFNIFHD